MSLLIEPVWNRNVIRFFGIGELANLLIEPVWNRNIGNKGFQYKIHAFNRTSLESKPEQSDPAFGNHYLLIEPVWNRNLKSLHLLGWQLRLTFNRTSLESKPGITVVVPRAVTLLIEPVWNRNLDAVAGMRLPPPF